MGRCELHDLVQRCRAEEEAAWELFAAWVKRRGRTILGAFGNLRPADRDDIVADTLKNLVSAVRSDRIRGRSNAEIDAYVCRSLRNQALNSLRGHVRRRTGEPTIDALGAHSEACDEAAVENSSQETLAIVAEQLERADKLLLSWSPEDRYVFLAKLYGVPAEVIQETLRRPPFKTYLALATIDTRFYRLRGHMMRHLREP